MKRVAAVLVATQLTSCAAMTADPWSWMDNPSEQSWDKVTIIGYGREIQFRIPDRLHRGGTHVIRGPQLQDGARDQVIEIPPEAQFAPALEIVQFNWERYWGGFVYSDKTYYKFRVYVNYYDDKPKLLKRDVNSRIDRIQDEFDRSQGGPYESNVQAKLAEFFYDRIYLEPYQSAQPYVWTLENQPLLLREHEYFRLPISDNHELIFWFWYHWVDEGGKTDPDWLEQRRALSRKILDTVTISPDPWVFKAKVEALNQSGES